MVTSDREDLIASIYEAGALPELWPSLLERLSHLVGARGGTLGRYRDGSPLVIHSPGIGDLIEGWVAGGYHIENARARPLRNLDYPGFVTDLDLHSEEQRRTMPCYRDFLIPKGADLGAGTAIPGASGDRLVLTIEVFPERDTLIRAVPRLDDLRPHLARAAVLSAELQLRASTAAVEALERVGTPAAMLGLQGQVIAANGAFAAALGTRMFDARDRLRLADRIADAAFADALGPLLRDGRGASVAIRDPHGRGHAALHLVPVSRRATDLFAGAGAIAVLARRAPGAAPASALIQTLFDLTPAEARVAIAIASGASIETIARSSAKSPETIRSHLKRVYSKTGTSRQNELALLLTGLTLDARS